MKNLAFALLAATLGCSSTPLERITYHPTPLAVLVVDTNQARFAVIDMPSLMHLQADHDVEVLLTTRNLQLELGSYTDVPFYLLRVSNVREVPDSCWSTQLYADLVPVLEATADYAAFRAYPVEELTPMLDSMETASFFLQVPWGTGSGRTREYENIVLRIIKRKNHE